VCELDKIEGFLDLIIYILYTTSPQTKGDILVNREVGKELA